MNINIKEIYKDLEKGFFGFWVRRVKVSYLLLFLIISAGIFSLITIPKESSPDIKFGIIGITTVYQGVNPTDIDSLITDKIEKEIKDVDGIKKITSSSLVGVSSVIIELDNDANIRNALTDIKDRVDKVNLPEDANDPSIQEISTTSDLMFEVLLYGDSSKFSKFDLMQKAQLLKNNLESKIPGLSSIDLGAADLKLGLGSSTSDDYEIKVFLDKAKIEQLNLSLVQISSIIKSYNKNTPIGNYTIGDLNYDFRFDGELSNIEELKNLVIKSTYGSDILLKDIGIVKKEYKDDSIKKLGFKDNKGLNYVSLTFNKNAGTNVFDVSGKAKEELEKYISKNGNFEGLNTFYVNDISEIIIEDYKNLAKTAIQTLLLVFVTILLFVGLKESLIASTLIPISFLITFIVLSALGLSLNFLTNFSLVLTLGIAIDTVIVIIEGASEKIKLGYSKRSAILLAVRDYKSPLISGTMTTLVAFLPLIFLPGVMGKFLAYIPITVFSTLVGALVLALTISSALFILFISKGKTFHKDEKLEATFTPEQEEFLEYERKGKKEQKYEKIGLRDKILTIIGTFYYNLLEKIIVSTKNRILLLITPIIMLILTFLFLSPKIGFILFPSTDNSIMSATIETKEGTDDRFLLKYLDAIDNAIYKYDELKVYNMTVSDNKININIELLNKNIRKDKGMMSVFEIEEKINDELKTLESEGLSVSIEALKEGPPTGKAVGIKLIASNASKVEDLKKVASIFKEHFKTIEGLKNISTSSSESPGQFIFKFDRSKLAQVGLTPNDILNEVYFYTNGLKSGSIKSEYEDNDIVLKISQFEDDLSPDDINNLIINTAIGKIRVGDFANYEFTKAVSSINRENGKISITVESDIVKDRLPSEFQPILDEYALGYNFPDGINYQTGGENVENRDLIVSTISSLFIALFLIFSILVFQFNSFAQPFIVLYSVVLALLGVNIGLFVTGNPYSMTFMIGFIALTGVVVNDAIILIDRINKNLAKGIDGLHSVISAGKSRLQPIMVTTLTTVFGVLPLALQDEFWAGLGFTIIFGLTVGSAMTLFAIPSLYYGILVDKDNK